MGQNQTHNDFASHDLKKWRESMGLSMNDACALLEVPIYAFEQWEKGEVATPKHIHLACAALALGIKV